MLVTNPTHDEILTGQTHTRITDVPTDLLANRFVGALILANGNLLKYEALTAYLIRELRGEPHPSAEPTKQGDIK